MNFLGPYDMFESALVVMKGRVPSRVD